MRHYEVAYIIDPTLEEEPQAAIVARFRQLVESRGGNVQDVDRWERRRLAYEVKGKREGFYVIMTFNSDPETEAEMGRLLGLADGVLRHMTIRIDEKQAAAAVQRGEQRVIQQAEQARAAERAAAERAAAERAAAAAAAAAPPPAVPAADGQVIAAEAAAARPDVAAEAAPAPAPAASPAAPEAPAAEPAAAQPATATSAEDSAPPAETADAQPEAEAPAASEA